MAVEADVRVIARGDTRLCWREGTPPVLDSVQRQEVDVLWARGVAKSGSALHDSPLLAYRGHETAGGVTVIEGEFRPYRYYYAQCQRSDLDCGVDPIGVSGLMLLDEGPSQAVVIGRRSEQVSWYPGCWECVPSGGVDDTVARPDGTVDFAAMLTTEFEEEVCLPGRRIERVTPFAVIHDRRARTYDICCELPVRASREEVIEAIGASEEYSEVMVVNEADLAACLAELGGEMIALSRAIIELRLGERRGGERKP
ncbi:MAG: hypothetical protein GY842_26815 [bacterium]|nr:hypothetical protein [bacterium]